MNIMSVRDGRPRGTINWPSTITMPVLPTKP